MNQDDMFCNDGYRDEDSSELTETPVDGFGQLKRWQARGYEVALTTDTNGRWHVALGTANSFMRYDISPLQGNAGMSLYYISPPCSSPEEAIVHAMRVVQP